MAAPTTIKKYANRRLYDTGESRYVTLEELAEKIRKGTDVRVVDAATAEDLTQATLAQIILESRGASKLLPVPLLIQLIRMRDDALAEFLGRYLSAALEMYTQARQGAQALAPYNPLATLPFSLTSGLARLMSNVPFWADAGQPPMPQPMPSSMPPVPPPDAPGAAPPAPPPSAAASDVADLRRELEEMKTALRDAVNTVTGRGKKRKRAE